MLDRTPQRLSSTSTPDAPARAWSIRRVTRGAALVMAVTALGGLGCTAPIEDEEEVESSAVAPLTSDADAYAQEGQEVGFPASAGTRRKVLFKAHPGGARVLDVVDHDGEFVLEGDIVLPPSAVEVVSDEEAAALEDGSAEPEASGAADGVGTAEQAVVSVKAEWRWPNGKVFYRIAKDLPNKERVTKAIAHWEAKTSLRFVKRTTQASYVVFRRGSGCSATIGHTGTRQFVNLAKNCTTGSVIHEIGHTVGLWHEHQRADRDGFVTVKWANIANGYDFAFRKVSAASTDVPTNYDLRSIMHYGSTYFSKNGRPTIVKQGGGKIDPNRAGLSTRDLNGIAKLYGPNQ